MKMMMGFLIGAMVVGLLLAGALSAVLTGAQSENCETELSPNISSLQEEELKIEDEHSEDGNKTRVVVICRPGGTETTA